MKKIFLYLLITAIFSLEIYSQTNEKSNLELGVYLMPDKICLNPKFSSVGYVASIGILDFGISAFYPLNENKDVAALLEVGNAFYSIYESKETSSDFNTIDISPQIYLKGFTIGFDFGFFYSLKKNSSLLSQYDYKRHLQYPYLLNLKFGGIIPVYKIGTGTLNVLVKATTSLSNIGYNYYIGNYLLLLSSEKIQIISASVGLNYMFTSF